MMIAGPHHFAIKVRNLGAAERFYREVLGLKVARRWSAASGSGDRSVWLETGDDAGAFLALEVLSNHDTQDGQNGRDGQDRTESRAHGEPSVGESHAAGHHLLALRIRRDERSLWESRLLAAGVAVTGRSAYTLYFDDPEGNRLGLSHHPEPVIDRVADPLERD